MKKIVVLIFTLCVSITMFASNIGVVDSQKVAQNYDGYKEAMNFLNGEGNRLQADLDERKKEYEAEAAKITEASTTKEKEDLTRKRKALDSYFSLIKQSLAQQEAEQMNKVRADILLAIKEVAKQEGLDIIVEKQAVIFGGKDCTQNVIDFLAGAEKIDL